MVDAEPPDLERWAAEARDDATITERARAASLRRRRTLEASLGGVLVDLVEQALPVLVGVAGGEPLQGVVEAVGPDHLRLRTASAELALVPVAHVLWVRGGPGRPATVPGDRPVPPAGPLDARLHDLAEQQATVRVRTSDGATTTGRLVAAGGDVLVVHAAQGPTYLARTAVTVVWPDLG